MNKDQIIIYNTTDGEASVMLYIQNGKLFLSQAKIAELFDTSIPNVNTHIKNILSEGELIENSVIKDYLITASDGKKYTVIHYSLAMILAIGFRVKSKRGTQFRKWANQNLQEYMIKGFVMDDERLKNPDGHPEYFEELLARIRDIRSSEKKFYQKVRDLFALSSDYDKKDKSVQMFFAETQNKILYAITNMTVTELIVSRADDDKLNMALNSWKGSVVRKQDIYIAKNYLNEDELDSLNRFVNVFLEVSELRAKNNEDLTMSFWRDNVDKIIELNNKELLQNSGKISQDSMKKIVAKVYKKFDSKRKVFEAKKADKDDLFFL